MNETKKRRKKFNSINKKKQESFHLIQLKFTFLRNFGVDNVCGSVHISDFSQCMNVPVYFIYKCKTLNSSAFKLLNFPIGCGTIETDYLFN